MPLLFSAICCAFAYSDIRHLNLGPRVLAGALAIPGAGLSAPMSLDEFRLLAVAFGMFSCWQGIRLCPPPRGISRRMRWLSGKWWSWFEAARRFGVDLGCVLAELVRFIRVNQPHHHKSIGMQILPGCNIFGG